MIPGQMRTVFARNDRLIRRMFVAVVALAWVVTLFGISAHAGPGLLPYFLFLIALVIALQVAYQVRSGTVRRVAKELAERFAGDRFLVGNVRFVGPSDRGPEGVRYQTVIVQFSHGALAFWNPDKASEAFFAMPLNDLDVDIPKSKTPRWRIVAPLSDGETYLALWGDFGLAIEKADRLRELANALRPGCTSQSRPRVPEGPSGSDAQRGSSAAMPLSATCGVHVRPSQ